MADPNQDHRCWERPEDMDTPRNIYRITAQNPGSDVAAETAAALAAASIVFKNCDPAYSAKLLHAATKVYKIISKFLNYKKTNYLEVFERNNDSYYLLSLCKCFFLFLLQVFDFADRYRGSYSDSLSSVVCPFYCSYSGYHVRSSNLY